MTTNPKPNKALKVGEAERVPQGGGGGRGRAVLHAAPITRGSSFLLTDSYKRVLI